MFHISMPILLVAASQGIALAEDARPRVLIIGDSVYIQPASMVRTALKDEAEVVHARLDSGTPLNASTALEQLGYLLGYYDRHGEQLADEDRPKWDVIHFNVGLGDIIHRAPGMKSFRVLPIHAGGVRATPAEQYRTSLHELVTRLQATGAKLIWANTTPIRHSSTNVFQLGSEVDYNVIAADVMAEHEVPVNDMYTHVKGLIDMNKPASHGADPFFFDRKEIHMPMVRMIRDQLRVD